MTKKQARLFAFVCSFGFLAIFLGLTVHTHTVVGEQSGGDRITPAVVAGKDVWHHKNCINCHTIMGEGAYYAPDLTKITEQRGEAYLTAFLKDPSQFYSEKKHRRVMPNLNLTDDEISNVIAFMDWVSQIDTNGWPPRPINVSGGTIPSSGTMVKAVDSDAGGSAPEARGESLFQSPQGTCSACHSLTKGIDLAGPSLGGIVTKAEEHLASPDYNGKATDVRTYLHESIVDPSIYLVPGDRFSNGGVSLMPSNFGTKFTEEQVNDLVDFLLTLK